MLSASIHVYPLRVRKRRPVSRTIDSSSTRRTVGPAVSIVWRTIAAFSDALPDIAASLKIEKRGIDSVQRQELLVRAGFHHGAGMQDDDPVGHADGGEAVRDEQRDALGSVRA